MEREEVISLCRGVIRTIPDFPKEGIAFKDISPLLSEQRVFRSVIELLAERYAGQKVDGIVGIEARGFIFGSVLAYELGIPFVPVRKKGTPAPGQAD